MASASGLRSAVYHTRQMYPNTNYSLTTLCSPTMVALKQKKGKGSSAKTYDDKYTVNRTFTSVSSSASGSPSKTRVHKVDLGYEQPKKKPKFDIPQVSRAPHKPSKQSQDTSEKNSRSQVSSGLYFGVQHLLNSYKPPLHS